MSETSQLEVKHVRVHVDPGKLHASVRLRPEAPDVAADICIITVLGVVREQGLHAIDEEAVRAWAAAGMLKEPVEVATGLAPEHGEDGRVDLAAEAAQAERVEARATAQSVDYREWNVIHTVQPEEVIARVHPPTQGTAGLSVFGDELPPRPGKPAQLRAGPNVTVEEVDGIAVYTSTIEGLPQLEGSLIEVSPVYVVQGNVDLNVGNIRFNGDVIVNGDVRENFVIEATGRIDVHGNVVKSALVAEGDITVDGTIYGKEGIAVQGARDVSAGGAENATIEAGGNLRIQGNAIQSHFVATVAYLGHEADGYVRGGRVEATSNITVGNVGSSESAILTNLEIKREPGLRRDLKEMKEQEGQFMSDQDLLDRKLVHLRRAHEQGRTLSPEEAERLDGLEAQAHQLRERRTELEFDKGELAERVLAERSVAITVLGHVYPDARFTIHTESLDVREHRDGVHVSVTKDGLLAGPIPVSATDAAPADAPATDTYPADAAVTDAAPADAPAADPAATTG